MHTHTHTHTHTLTPHTHAYTYTHTSHLTHMHTPTPTLTLAPRTHTYTYTYTWHLPLGLVHSCMHNNSCINNTYQNDLVLRAVEVPRALSLVLQDTGKVIVNKK